MAKGSLLGERRWFRAVFAVAELLMAVGFVWVLVVGWDALPLAVLVVFFSSCCTAIVCAAFELWEHARRQSVT